MFLVGFGAFFSVFYFRIWCLLSETISLYIHIYPFPLYMHNRYYNIMRAIFF